MPSNPAPTITIPGMSGRYLSGLRGGPLPSAADRARPHRLAPEFGSQSLHKARRRMRGNAATALGTTDLSRRSIRHTHNHARPAAGHRGGGPDGELPAVLAAPR